MKFKISRHAFLAAVGRISGLSGTSGPVRALSHLLLEADQGRLSIAATDNESMARISVEADIITPGSTLVSTRKLRDLLSAMPEGLEVSAEVDPSTRGRFFRMDCGRGTYKLAPLDVHDWPEFSRSEVIGKASIPAPVFLDAIAQTIFACAGPNDVRIFLHGALMEVSPGALRLVTTDGHRLALADVPASPDSAQFSGIIPKKVLQELGRAIRGFESDVVIEYTGAAAHFSVENVRMDCRLIAGHYPAYKGVLPAVDPTDHITLVRADISEAIGRLTPLLTDKERSITMAVGDGCVRLTAGVGADDAEDEVGSSHPPGMVGRRFRFNQTYVNDAISALAGENVRLQIPTGKQAVLLVDPSPDAGQSLHVVMPLNDEAKA